MTGEAKAQNSTSYLSLYAVSFLVGVVMISLGPVLDPILTDLHIPLSEGGLISMAFALGMLCGVVALNFFMARVPLKWALVGASWLLTVALAGSALLSHNLWSLFVAYFFVGLGAVILNLLPGMWVSCHIKTNTGRALIILLQFFAFGMMITPVVIGVALGWGVTWRRVFGFESVLSLLLALVLTTRPISDITGRENLRWRQVREVVGFNPRLFSAIVGTGFLYVGAEFIMNVWLAKFTIDVFGAGKNLASYVVALFWAGLVIARLIMIPLTRRVPASRLLLVGATTMAAFALAEALSVSLPMAMTMAFFCGLGASASYALIISFSSRFKAWHAGVVYSAMVMGSSFGRLVFPYAIGPIAHSFGFRVAMSLAVVLAALVSLLSLVLRRVSGEGAATAH